MRALVYQSFNVFNIYGREPESLESILLGFTIALEDIPLDYITRAFKDWLKTNTDMPLPANIRKDAMEWIEIDRKKQERDSLPKLENHHKMAEPRVINAVPWAFMSYEQICRENMLNQVKDWITDELKPLNKHEDYIKYLKDFCNFPQNFTGVSEL